ncbi:hypothetical protein ACIQMO_27785 [Streptomyces sp. NPDC091406]|uniref:DUF7144 family membrane protein n=1 Tax=unclassified Streptomyces TaxID=2593676 RepID=UPI0037F945B8
MSEDPSGTAGPSRATGPSGAADPARAQDPSQAIDPPGPADLSRPDGRPPSGPGQQPRPGPGQEPRTGPGQGDTPWQRADGPAVPAPVPDPGSLWVTGGVLLAGMLMLCQGVVAALEGIAALADGDVYGDVGEYLYRISLAGWGWIHLVLGVCVAVTGAALLRGARWARVAGILFASLSLFAHFLFLPYAPLWSVIVIALDIFIIWALSAYRDPDPVPAGVRR